MEEHRELLSAHGASVTAATGALKLESKLPHLVTISSGLDFGINIYTLKEGMTRFGLENEDQPQDVVLNGEGIEPEHCIIEHNVEVDPESGQLKEVRCPLKLGLNATLTHMHVLTGGTIAPHWRLLRQRR